MAGSIYTFTKHNFNAPADGLAMMNEAVAIRVKLGQGISRAADLVENAWKGNGQDTIKSLTED